MISHTLLGLFDNSLAIDFVEEKSVRNTLNKSYVLALNASMWTDIGKEPCLARV